METYTPPSSDLKPNCGMFSKARCGNFSHCMLADGDNTCYWNVNGSPMQCTISGNTASCF
ncbi:MAG: hypothetical protein AAF471_04380 [Myxococcota bacterium]